MRSDHLDIEAAPSVQIEHAPPDIKACALRAFKAGAFVTFGAPGRYRLTFEDVCAHGTYSARTKTFSLNGFPVDVDAYRGAGS
jgi:hypothetical protein